MSEGQREPSCLVMNLGEAGSDADVPTGERSVFTGFCWSNLFIVAK